MRRFFPKRYFTAIHRKKHDEAMNWPYWKANIERRYVGFGRMRVIGFYSDYIRQVNKRMRPRKR